MRSCLRRAETASICHNVQCNVQVMLAFVWRDVRCTLSQMHRCFGLSTILAEMLRKDVVAAGVAA